jgi:hypothetical protein
MTDAFITYHVVSFREPIYDEISLIGPFDDHDTAFKWAEENHGDTEYQIVKMLKPVKEGPTSIVYSPSS